MSFYGWADRTSGRAQIENHSETAWTGAQASSLALLLRPATETVALQSNHSFEIRAAPDQRILAYVPARVARTDVTIADRKQ